MRRPIGPAAALSNPANVEYEVVRTTLLPGALKTLAFNKAVSHKEGVKLFEFSDVVLPCENEIGARNERHFVALYASHTSSFEVIHGLVDRIMALTQILPESGYASNSLSADDFKNAKRVAREGIEYSVKPSADPTYFPGMGAEVVLRDIMSGAETSVGGMGVVHPDVLANFEISYPLPVVELNLEALM